MSSYKRLSNLFMPSPLVKGSFLIASPFLDQGLYFRSVILLCEHSETGSFGLIINKPLEVEIPEDLFSFEKTLNPRVSLLSSGINQPNQLILLHSSPSDSEHTLSICDGVFLGGDLTFLQKNIQESEGPYLHLCFGYCLWGPGLLEKEVLSEAWYVHPATQEKLFLAPKEELWTTLLQEMGGKYADLTKIPEDLTLN